MATEKNECPPRTQKEKISIQFFLFGRTPLSASRQGGVSVCPAAFVTDGIQATLVSSSIISIVKIELPQHRAAPMTSHQGEATWLLLLPRIFLLPFSFSSPFFHFPARRAERIVPSTLKLARSFAYRSSWLSVCLFFSLVTTGFHQNRQKGAWI